MNRKSKRASIVAASAAVVVAVGGAAAYAAWFSTGQGEVTGTTGTDTGIAVSALSVGTNLRPGHPVNVSFTLTNNDDYKKLITGISINSITSTNLDCNAPGTFKASTILPAGFLTELGANEARPLVWTAAVSLTGTPDDDCQGSPFKVLLDVNADSAEA